MNSWTGLVLLLPAISLGIETACFDFEKQSPERQPVDETDFETWCYFEQSPSSTLVYRASHGELAPETSFRIQRDEDGKIRHFAHFSRNQGELEFYEQTPFLFNPFIAPLSRVEALRMARAARHLRWNTEMQDAVRELKFRYDTTRPRTIVKSRPWKEVEEIRLPVEKEPRDGYWWPHDGVPLARPDFSPLRKYDRYVESLTGIDPKSRDWELQYHSLEHVPWGGHCNGWAASAILYPFFEKFLYSPSLDLLIRPSDIQGMRSETSFCVDWAFYGLRYRGPEDDITDIHPDRFHKVMEYYIKHLQKPVIMDYFPHEKIDNNIASGYRFTYGELTDGRVRVDAEIQMHGYSFSALVENDRPAKKYIKRLSYYLDIDSTGYISGGEWISRDNPDFLWVPLAQSKCGRENPRMDHQYVERLAQERWTELKENTYRNSTSFTDLLIQPGETIVLWEPEINALEFNIKQLYIAASQANLTLIFTWTDPQGTTQIHEVRYYASVYNHRLPFKGTLSKIQVKNNAGAESQPSSATIELTYVVP